MGISKVRSVKAMAHQVRRTAGSGFTQWIQQKNLRCDEIVAH